jgi:hypothetical protein
MHSESGHFDSAHLTKEMEKVNDFYSDNRKPQTNGRTAVSPSTIIPSMVERTSLNAAKLMAVLHVLDPPAPLHPVGQPLSPKTKMLSGGIGEVSVIRPPSTGAQ